MKYYITTPELAQGVSAVKAQQMGCSGMTSFWWGIITHPSNGQSAICFIDEDYTLADAVYDEEGGLIVQAETVKVLYSNNSIEIKTNDLKDDNYMVSNDWFSVESGV